MSKWFIWLDCTAYAPCIVQVFHKIMVKFNLLNSIKTIKFSTNHINIFEILPLKIFLFISNPFWLAIKFGYHILLYTDIQTWYILAELGLQESQDWLSVIFSGVISKSWFTVIKFKIWLIWEDELDMHQLNVYYVRHAYKRNVNNMWDGIDYLLYICIAKSGGHIEILYIRYESCLLTWLHKYLRFCCNFYRCLVFY